MHEDLKLSDLRGRTRGGSRMMNVKVPVYVSDAITKVARDLKASKTEVVVALLNEGLAVSQETLRRLGVRKNGSGASRRRK